MESAETVLLKIYAGNIRVFARVRPPIGMC